jgi:beta-lactamase class A
MTRGTPIPPIENDPALPEDVAGLCEELMAQVGCHGSLYARNASTGASLALRPDEPVVTASVFKTAVLLELHRQAAAGELDLGERLRLGPEQRVFGPTGLSCFSDEAEMSLRDLAVLMMSISDNTATDALLRRVGLDRVNGTLRELGRDATHLAGGCADLLNGLLVDLALGPSDDPAVMAVAPARLAATRALTPAHTTRSTARDTTELLLQIWNDTAGPAPACAQVRQVLALQAWSHGLRAGTEPGMAYAGKTGSLPGVRNEAGVMTTADGAHVALSVFLRYPTDRLIEQRPDIDRTITELGRVAVRAVTRRS